MRRGGRDLLPGGPPDTTTVAPPPVTGPRSPVADSRGPRTTDGRRPLDAVGEALVSR
ncbi:MAG: hypothetical protein AVDCRST_MAG70-1469 [uncultured Thermomicrobiales bacterium]|uniref:Uncharacterized protein n=1 Tax=uncultured Thermomicrobiales bacterium TaxID=1645740 RepID=A0A6J4USB5_9BACT|nr:MAG: hypothetical protein AVDCRST_MAG70-1469 [uncultured Thermomicrobiales bacterium]